jgi:ribose 5-phosphate isomerase A
MVCGTRWGSAREAQYIETCSQLQGALRAPGRGPRAGAALSRIQTGGKLRAVSRAKEAAGRAAAEQVRDGMTVGLGTGSTVLFTLQRLAERIRTEHLTLRGVPTSLDTEGKARALGIPLATLDEVEKLDLTIDGADEIDARFDMIKGGGGALLREKVVASLTRREVIVVDAAKVVARLGVRFPLPVEVVPFARAPVARRIARLGASWTLRMRDGAEPVLTDNGNEILDCRFTGGIADPAGLERALDEIPGVVESGLFVGLAHVLVVGHDDGRVAVDERTA